MQHARQECTLQDAALDLPLCTCKHPCPNFLHVSPSLPTYYSKGKSAWDGPPLYILILIAQAHMSAAFGFSLHARGERIALLNGLQTRACDCMYAPSQTCMLRTGPNLHALHARAESQQVLHLLMANSCPMNPLWRHSHIQSARYADAYPRAQMNAPRRL